MFPYINHLFELTDFYCTFAPPVAGSCYFVDLSLELFPESEFPESKYGRIYREALKSVSVEFRGIEGGRQNPERWDTARSELVELGTRIYNRIRESDLYRVFRWSRPDGAFAPSLIASPAVQTSHSSSILPVKVLAIRCYLPRLITPPSSPAYKVIAVFPALFWIKIALSFSATPNRIACFPCLSTTLRLRQTISSPAPFDCASMSGVPHYEH